MPLRYFNPKKLYLIFRIALKVIQVVCKWDQANNKKSTSHDNLSPLVLKLFTEQIAMPLFILINMLMSEGIVPDELEIAKIIHFHKSNTKDDISNYRPISLLPSISKTLGKVVYKRTFHFIQTNTILSNNRYVFLKNVEQ